MIDKNRDTLLTALCNLGRAFDNVAEEFKKAVLNVGIISDKMKKINKMGIIMIDQKFILDLEGFSLNGYVPDIENSKSGVTIASGFDIGQHSADEIETLFNVGLANKLLPYIGLTRFDAVDALKQTPLLVTHQEAQQINAMAHRESMYKLIQLWGKHSDVSFSQIPRHWMTVIASVAFQYGNLAHRTPVFWSQVVNFDHERALANLRNFGDKYPTRRNKEADYIEVYSYQK